MSVYIFKYVGIRAIRYFSTPNVNKNMVVVGVHQTTLFDHKCSKIIQSVISIFNLSELQQVTIPDGY